MYADRDGGGGGGMKRQASQRSLRSGGGDGTQRSRGRRDNGGASGGRRAAKSPGRASGGARKTGGKKRVVKKNTVKVARDDVSVMSAGMASTYTNATAQSGAWGGAPAVDAYGRPLGVASPAMYPAGPGMYPESPVSPNRYVPVGATRNMAGPGYQQVGDDPNQHHHPQQGGGYPGYPASDMVSNGMMSTGMVSNATYQPDPYATQSVYGGAPSVYGGTGPSMYAGGPPPQTAMAYPVDPSMMSVASGAPGAIVPYTGAGAASTSTAAQSNSAPREPGVKTSTRLAMGGAGGGSTVVRTADGAEFDLQAVEIVEDDDEVEPSKTQPFYVGPVANRNPDTYFKDNIHIQTAEGTFVYRCMVIVHWILGAWYLWFRITETVNPDAPWFSGIFITVEIWFYFTSFGFYMSMWKRITHDIARLDKLNPHFPEKDWPNVDCFVCCYSEPIEVVRETLRNILDLDYPPSKMHVYVCDDGGTKEVEEMVQQVYAEGNEQLYTVKITDKVFTPHNTRRPDAALGSHTMELRMPGQPVVSYISRKKAPVHYAKAGNLNNVIFNEGSSGEFLMFFDADMVPSPPLLKAVIPYFYRYNPGTKRYEHNNIAFVQTPQVFRNLDAGDPFGNKNAIFYGPIIQGRDGFNAVPFVGTNAIVRRVPIEQVGGYPTDSVTEDVYMSMRLQAVKWSAVYHDEPLVLGLAPDDTDGVFSQRMRWAMGALQILLRENPLRKKGLTVMQKYLYFDAALYPFSAVFTLIFIMIPIFFCLSGIPPFQMNDGLRFCLFFLPFYLTGRIALYFATRDVDKNDVWREQQLQYGFSIIYFMALVQVFTGKRIKFAVTKKDGSKARHPLVKPLFAIEAATYLAMAAASARYFLDGTLFKNSEWAPLMAQPWVYVAAMAFALSTITHLSTILAKARSKEEGGRTPLARFHVHNVFVVLSVCAIGIWQQYNNAANA